MLIEQLKTIVGSDSWTTDPEVLAPHLSEWRDLWRGKTLIMVSPNSTDEVAALVSACRAANTAIVPQGGNTGLCGGAIPDESGKQVLVSLSRMNRVRQVSADDHSMVVEAGCTLSAVQAAAAEANRFFPLSLGAEGSCQIGGNISTNAGGINVLRYGNARSQVLGLEVVLADGQVWNGLRQLRKDNAGYDLKQLFIGSEGTLGIITAAALRMYPEVSNVRTILFAVDSPDKAVQLLSFLRYRHGDQIQAFELISDRAVRYVRRHVPSIRFPIEEHYPWYVLTELTNCEENSFLENVLVPAVESGNAHEAVIAKNEGERQEMWRLRHTIPDIQKREGASLKHDVSVPTGSVPKFINAASDAVIKYMTDIRPVAFGHVGDGNIHFNLSQPVGSNPEKFLAHAEALANIVYDVVEGLGGSFSAEHGIGQAKRHYLEHYRGQVDLELMRSIKGTLDPDNLLNPGKVL
ncbi:MAG: hydroxyacid dehydrogenase [Woeseia sp.]|nr:hydroxyacid dehydrogenase [Woeseia sp.]